MKEISDKRNVSNDPMEDKLALFRQQVVGSSTVTTDEYADGRIDKVI